MEGAGALGPQVEWFGVLVTKSSGMGALCLLLREQGLGLTVVKQAVFLLGG